MKKSLRFSLLSMLLMLCGTTMAETVVDKLTWQGLGLVATNSNYNDFSGAKFNSSAVYAGTASSGTGQYIQLRTKNSNEGIVTTTSGGKLKSVTINFNEKTTDRSIVIYGKNEAYASAADLYDASKQGTKLGVIAANDESMVLKVSGDYTYVGMASTNSAIYIDDIEVEWESDGTTPVVTTAAQPTFSPNGGEVEDGTLVKLSCATPDAKIVYFINELSEETMYDYTEPFALNFGDAEKITIIALAYLVDDAGAPIEDSESEAVEAVFTKKAPVEIPELTTCAVVLTEGVDGELYHVKGTCKEIQNTTYGNWILEDETGEILIYGTLDAEGNTKNFTSLGIEEGDVVEVCGPRKTFKTTTIELVDVTVLSITKKDVGTGISEVAADKAQAEVYNLRGQRVAQPQRGLYIIGGRKVVMK